MKKYLAIVLALLPTFFICSSCSNKSQYTVLEVGDYDYVSNAEHAVEFSLQTEETIEFRLFNEKQISFDGEEYVLDYECTKKGYLFNTEVDYYSKMEDGEHVEFGINQETGVIDSYWWVDRNYLKEGSLTERSHEECLAIAKSYLAVYVDDVDSYELVNERYLEIPEYNAIYSIEYARVIDGVKTSDRAYIDITIYGTVSSHLFISLGEMKGAVMPNHEELDAIKADIDSKLSAIYVPTKTEYSVSYELNEMVFLRLADGRYALEYYYDVQLSPLDEDRLPISEMTHLIVIL